MKRWRDFVEALGGAHTARLYAPRGWLAVCAGWAQEARTRPGARVWIMRRAWHVSGDDLDRTTCAECGRARGHAPNCSSVAELEEWFNAATGLRRRGGLREWLRLTKGDRDET